MPTLIEEIEGFLAESAETVGRSGAAGEAAIPVAADEAAAAGVALTATEFFPVVVVLGMLAAASAWLRPQFEAHIHHHHSVLFRVVTWPARRLRAAVVTVEHRVLHSMSHWLAPKTRAVAHWINATAHIVHNLTGAVEELADNTHEALVWLRHHVLPQQINNATRPLRRSLRVLANATDSINERIHTAALEVAGELETIGRTVSRTFTGAIGQLAVVVVELWTYVHRTLAPRIATVEQAIQGWILDAITTLTTTVEVTIPNAMRELGTRLQRVEDALAPAAFAAAVVVAVRQAFDYLTCRNMQRLGREVCAAEEATLDALLAALLGAVLLSDIRTLAREAEQLESGLVSIVKDVLSA